MYANMPASRAIALPDRLSSRSKIGRSGVVHEVAGGTGVQAAGTSIIASYVLPAAINTSLCTRETPGRGLPSSATREKPGTGAAVVPDATTAGVVREPTIEGTCMRKPALTRRTKTFPVTGAATVPGGVTANCENPG